MIFPLVQQKIKTYETKARNLKKRELKGGKQYSAELKAQQKTYTTRLTKEKADTQQKHAALRTILQTSTAGMSKAAKTAYYSKLRHAKEAWFEATKSEGLTQRSIHDLYSHSCTGIVNNLKKDLNMLKQFQRAVPTAAKMKPL